ncbi:hypothetical protein AURDEDRAFT_169904 [Auricularia subglabra TFB-10046 SS5]|nr:hypothetical protein AURDEDRAFT_169904 [Auricularia subglabra TFB-10046 SS5]
MNRFLKLTAIACPAVSSTGVVCGKKTSWQVTTRTSMKKEFSVAVCDSHMVVALYLGNGMVLLFTWAPTVEDRDKMPLTTHPERNSDPCTACSSAANQDCRYWLCKACCVKLRAPCSEPDHRHARQLKGEADAGYAPLPLKLLIYLEPGDSSSLPIDLVVSSSSESGPEGRTAGALVPAIGRPVLAIVTVYCEHRWAANAARTVGRQQYQTRLLLRPREGREFFRNDFTEDALKELKLRGIKLERLRIFDGDGDYVFTFPGKDNNPDDACFAREVCYGADNSIEFVVGSKQREIGLHTTLKEEEVFADLDCEWKTLRPVRLLVTCERYSKGYCRGKVTRIVKECSVRRRRFKIEDCKVTLADFDPNDLKKLKLTKANLRRTDDGEPRNGGIKRNDPLDSRPYREDFSRVELNSSSASMGRPTTHASAARRKGAINTHKRRQDGSLEAACFEPTRSTPHPALQFGRSVAALQACSPSTA